MKRLGKIFVLDITAPYIYCIGKMVGRREAKKEIRARKKHTSCNEKNGN